METECQKCKESASLWLYQIHWDAWEIGVISVMISKWWNLKRRTSSAAAASQCAPTFECQQRRRSSDSVQLHSWREAHRFLSAVHLTVDLGTFLNKQTNKQTDRQTDRQTDNRRRVSSTATNHSHLHGFRRFYSIGFRFRFQSFKLS